MTVVKRTAEIAASPEKLIAIMLDVANHHEWQKNLDKAEVLSTDDQGRPLVVLNTVTAMGQAATYTVEYTYPESGGYEYHLTEGDVMTRFDFTFNTVPGPDGASEVTITQDFAIKWPLPAFMVDQLALKGVKDTLKSLAQFTSESA